MVHSRSSIGIGAVPTDQLSVARDQHAVTMDDGQWTMDGALRAPYPLEGRLNPYSRIFRYSVFDEMPSTFAAFP